MTRTPYYLVQPRGLLDRYQQATVTSIHDTAEGAYARLDAISAKLQRDGAPPLITWSCTWWTPTDSRWRGLWVQ